MTTKTQHTPGPWKYKVFDYSNRILANNDKTQIALVIEDNGITFHPSEENARLIAAAPELLERLKEALEIMRLFADNHMLKNLGHIPQGQLAEILESLFSEIKASREAISKAEGEL